MSVEFKAVVGVSEMARMVGLSRARFYELLGKTFPFPVYSVSTKRPFYDQEMQTLCLEVRRSNCGIDGKPILFYARRSPDTNAKPKRRPSIDPNLLDGLRSLGLSPTTAQVEAAVKVLFPSGTAVVDP